MKEESLMTRNRKIIRITTSILFLMFVIAVSVTGSSNAWFTSGADTSNTLTAGTLSIDVGGPASGTSLNPGACTSLAYDITNTGSKRAYVRARFEGFWRKTYHRNTATATVSYNNETFTASDSAHYSYGNYIPDINLPGGSIGTIGFTDEVSLSPLVFLPLNIANGATNDSQDVSNDVVSVISEYPVSCIGPLVDPVIGKEYPQYFANGDYNKDPASVLLPTPDTCSLLKSFKIDADHNGVADGSVHTDGGFVVTIYKKLIDGKYYFAFQSNYPVYHVYAKGGNAGGNFYMYYPAYPDGVYSDCGLSQPGGDWSHITFYYCEPPEDPSLAIKKYVSVDGGASWDDADTPPEPVIQPPIAPQFKFVVTNTGNVTLTGIVVTDDYFGHIGTVSLNPGASYEFIVTDVDWEVNQVLSTANVTMKLCDGSSWLPLGPQQLGTYFYYTDMIASSASIPLCVQVCLDAGTGSDYDGAVFTLYAYFEAVQVTNNMVNLNWPGHPIP